jgi:hypothetical protein
VPARGPNNHPNPLLRTVFGFAVPGGGGGGGEIYSRKIVKRSYE